MAIVLAVSFLFNCESKKDDNTVDQLGLLTLFLQEQGRAQSGNCSFSQYRFTGIEATTTEQKLPNTDRSAGGAKIFFSAVIAKELKVGDSVFFRNIPTSPADPGIFYTTRGDDCNFVIGDSGSTSGLQRPSPFGSERNYTVTEDGDYSFMIERKLDTSQPFSDESVRIIKASN